MDFGRVPQSISGTRVKEKEYTERAGKESYRGRRRYDFESVSSDPERGFEKEKRTDFQFVGEADP